MSRPAPGGTRRTGGPKSRPSPKPTPTVRRRLRVALLIGFAVVLIAIGLIRILGSGGDSRPAAGEGNDPGVAHVHGLGIDPQDKTLYAATHFGVFRIPADGTPSRIADRYQDTMGFTVVGPQHFLGSGHPDPMEGKPANLGLIESTDGGETWRDLSLSGQADFHSLEAIHGQVFGYNSGTGLLMVSSDKVTWDERAELPMADFAVSPASADVLIATTENGPAASNDGGRTFTVAQGAPPLIFVSWPDSAALYGVTTSGAVLRSADQGKTWQQEGALDGRPAALTATDAMTVYAATDTGIYQSTNGGKSFEQRYRITG
ncbi:MULTISPECIES: F510_1955 family glycosylhydrolase [unclassified Kribbella]|uniref:F510_1955 family glycosylhydrolase n=1 Tax=unclassified Kribbella TaxID=2644121 RepID=UPI0030163C1B